MNASFIARLINSFLIAVKCVKKIRLFLENVHLFSISLNQYRIYVNKHNWFTYNFPEKLFDFNKNFDKISFS